MTFQQWWNSRHRSDFEEELYCGLQEVWEEATAFERERCAKLCEALPIGTGLQGKTFAEAIRNQEE